MTTELPKGYKLQTLYGADPTPTQKKILIVGAGILAGVAGFFIVRYLKKKKR